MPLQNIRLDGCWRFASLQHRRSCQVLTVTVHTHDDFIVLPQLRNQMKRYPTQSHYPDTELTSPCPILLMPTTKLGSDKYQFYKSLVWLDYEPKSQTRDLNSATAQHIISGCVQTCDTAHIWQLYRASLVERSKGSHDLISCSVTFILILSDPALALSYQCWTLD